MTIEIFDDNEQVAADDGNASLSYRESQRRTRQFLESNLTSIWYTIPITTSRPGPEIVGLYLNAQNMTAEARTNVPEPRRVIIWMCWPRERGSAASRTSGATNRKVQVIMSAGAMSDCRGRPSKDSHTSNPHEGKGASLGITVQEINSGWQRTVIEGLAGCCKEPAHDSKVNHRQCDSYPSSTPSQSSPSREYSCNRQCQTHARKPRSSNVPKNGPTKVFTSVRTILLCTKVLTWANKVQPCSSISNRFLE